LGLTVLKTQRLEGKDFPQLWTDHEVTWREMVTNAVEFLDRTLPPTERILADDLAEAIESLVAVNPHFTAHTDAQRLPQKYWARDFSDYIIFQIHGGPIVQRGGQQ
jgi:hypothetical protein